MIRFSNSFPERIMFVNQGLTVLPRDKQRDRNKCSDQKIMPLEAPYLTQHFP